MTFSLLFVLGTVFEIECICINFCGKMLFFFCSHNQLSEQEVEIVLDKCMVLFRFLQEKVC